MTPRLLRRAVRVGIVMLWAFGLSLYGFTTTRRGLTVSGWLSNAGVLALALGFGGIGLLLTIRRREHVVGWLLLGFAGAFALQLGAEGWALWRGSIAGRGELRLAAFLANAAASLAAIPLLMLMAVFPHGRLPRGRAGWALWVAVGTVLAGVSMALFSTYETEGVVLPAPVAGREEMARAVSFLAMLPMFVMFVVFPVRLVRLLSRGDPVERLQVRWVTYVLAVVLALLAISPLVTGANQVAGFIAGFGIPAAIWIAITRHGLYEIDRVISRTLTYTLVAGVLALIFAAGTVALPQLLPDGSGSIAVAGTTLAAAALFNPMRRRAQRFVESRYHRLPYVPDEVVAALARRLRGEVRPEGVLDAFAGSVSGALRPAIVTVSEPAPRNVSGTLVR